MEPSARPGRRPRTTGSLFLVGGRVIVLGTCGAWPEAGRACCGFVVEYEGYRVVIDLGYGTLPRLLTLLNSSVGEGIDAMVVTHEHPDHMVDVHGLFRARCYGWSDSPSLALYAPRGVLDRLCGMEDGADGIASVLRVFDWRPLPSTRQRVGPFDLDSYPLPHYVPNAGVRLSAPGLTVAYTGDTGPHSSLADLGRHADLYIVDATDWRRHAEASASPDTMNLTARAAGEAATKAGARRLLLTHFWPGNDREIARLEAAEVFDGEVIVAEEGLEIPLP